MSSRTTATRTAFPTSYYYYDGLRARGLAGGADA